MYCIKFCFVVYLSKTSIYATDGRKVPGIFKNPWYIQYAIILYFLFLSVPNNFRLSFSCICKVLIISTDSLNWHLINFVNFVFEWKSWYKLDVMFEYLRRVHKNVNYVVQSLLWAFLL